MAQNTSGFLFILLLVIAGFIMASGCTTSTPPAVPGTRTPLVTTGPAPAQSCMADDDCVPFQCCHPTTCINKADKGVCNVACTMSCEGPIDCGAGSCGCMNGKCSVIPSSPFPPGTRLP